MFIWYTAAPNMAGNMRVPISFKAGMIYIGVIPEIYPFFYQKRNLDRKLEKTANKHAYSKNLWQALRCREK